MENSDTTTDRKWLTSEYPQASSIAVQGQPVRAAKRCSPLPDRMGVLGRREIGKKSDGQGEGCMRGMKYNPENHRRRSIRLQGYDYSQPGWYFVTIVTHDRQNLFGRIENGKMILNDGGKIVRKCWLEIPDHYPNVNLDEFIVMPNHIHGIIDIVGGQNFVGVQNFEPLQRRRNKYQKIIPKSIGAITRGFKIALPNGFVKIPVFTPPGFAK